MIEITTEGYYKVNGSYVHLEAGNVLAFRDDLEYEEITQEEYEANQPVEELIDG